MLTFEQIKELIDQVASHSLSGIELERSGFRLKIDGQKRGAVEVVAPSQVLPERPAEVVAASVASVPAPVAAETPAAQPTESLPPNVHVLNSPIVGTFYRSPNPDSPPFAEVGDRVQSGQVLCIVEAMKLMNEIESDADGTIVEIYAENAQPVEYGTPLLAIKVGG